MASIIKTFREEIPAMRFIGKKYEGFGPWWGEWFANGWFDTIEKAMGGIDSILKFWENGGGYVGLERRAVDQPFEYWIGMFTPADTPVPEGFACVDFPAIGCQSSDQVHSAQYLPAGAILCHPAEYLFEDMRYYRLAS